MDCVRSESGCDNYQKQMHKRKVHNSFFHRSSADWAEGRKRRPTPSAASPPRGFYRRRVAPPRDRKGSEYANFDCQERVNAGQKVVQLGHATGTNIIPRVSPAAGRYHPGAASRYAVMVRAISDHKFKIGRQCSFGSFVANPSAGL